MREVKRIDLEAARQLLDFGARMGSDSRAQEQLEGAVALHNMLATHGCAYLADEVGMGKTYVALGAMALMQHFRPTLRVLVIAPRENIQSKWRKELGNLARHNVRFSDLRLRTMDERVAMPDIKCDSLLDLAYQTTLHSHGVFFARMTSFSLGLSSGTRQGAGTEGEGGPRQRMRDRLQKILPWVTTDMLPLRATDEAFKENFARVLCCALPKFDLVIVDEAHHLKHGFKPGAAARNRVMALALGRPGSDTSEGLYPGHAPKAERVLFLSATPIEESYTQLWNQLDVFGLGEKFAALKDKALTDEDKKHKAAQFLIRRVTSLKLGEAQLTKNLYRREWRRGGVDLHDDPIRVTDPHQRLVLALVQKKVAEVIGHENFGTAFQTGMLASFESFQQTAERKGGSSSGHSDTEEMGNFDDSDQTENALEREGIDVRGVNRLAKSYRNEFDGAELPHPKMDALVESLGEAWRTGEKALVFVRRVDSVIDIRRKLEERYDEWLFSHLQQALPPEVRPRLEGLITRYREERLLHRNTTQRRDTAPHLAVQAKDHDDTGGKDTFFAWFFRGEGPGGVLSGAALLKRFSTSGSVYSTFFEDNHVAALLQCEAEHTLATLGQVLGLEEAALRAQLCERAQKHLLTRAKKLARKDIFEAMQAAVVHWLKDTPGPWQELALVISHERFSIQPANDRSSAVLPGPHYASLLNVPTFFTELRRQPQAELRARLWPVSEAAGAAEKFREESLRAELLASAARLGHAMIDLYVLTIQQLKSMELRSRDTEEEDDGTGGQYHADRHRIHAYLDRLEQQRLTPLTGRGWAAFDELAEISAHFGLILDVNLPQAGERGLTELRKELGSRLLGSQQPVGGMYGAVNGRVIKQFRMPGYPMVLVSTDLLQEGEDLHTFCSRIHHYGISWTPSSMEQRTGRIDRVRSHTERRLLRQNAAEGHDKLQVYFPHLEDTVEVLQVRRLLTRMNLFLRLMHEGLNTPQDEERSVNVGKEILRHHETVPAIAEQLRTAFPVQEKDLRGPVKTLARTPGHAEALARRFTKLRDMQEPRLRSSLPAGVEITLEREGGDVAGRGRIFGTVRLERRQQPFGLYLHSFEDHLLVRCISPVGQVRGSMELEQELARPELRHCQVGALERANEDRSYDLTAEDDVLLAAPAHDLPRVIQLVLRVVRQADDMERVLLDNADKPLETFQEDMKRE